MTEEGDKATFQKHHQKADWSKTICHQVYLQADKERSCHVSKMFIYLCNTFIQSNFESNDIWILANIIISV